MSLAASFPIKQTESFVKLLASTDGRDKLGKFLQYGSRFLAWFLAAQNADKTTVARASALSDHLAMARKVTRFGKWLQAYIDLLKLLESLSSGGKKAPKLTLALLLTHLRNLSMANYFLFDHFVYAGKLQLFDKQSRAIQLLPTRALRTNATGEFSRLSLQSWLYGLVFSIALDTTNLINGYKEEARLSAQLRKLSLPHTSVSDVVPSDGMRSVDDDEEQEQLRIAAKKRIGEIKAGRVVLAQNYVRNFADFGIASGLLKYWSPNNGVLGILGMIAALIGGYQAWPKA